MANELVDVFAEMTCDWNLKFACVICMPSLKHSVLVPDFSKKVANKLNLPFIQSIKK